MDIWTLHKHGFSQRAIAQKLGISRNTVRKHLAAEGAPQYTSEKRQSALEPYKQMIQNWLSEDDYTATRVYDMVKLQGYSGSYPTVRRFVTEVREQNNRRAYIRFETLPGQQAQVDFSDFKMVLPDGSEQTVYCFSMILGFSRCMYLELVPHCQMGLFLECHQRAFAYFGGVPGEILYDNLKQVVTKHSAGQLKLNEHFKDFACHYRFKVNACPPYAAWVKGKVEKPFHYVRERFWRGYVFQGLEQANQDISRWLQVANTRLHSTTQEEVSARFLKEQPFLGELPQRSFDTSETMTRKVFQDCQISFKGNRYVVPHTCVGKRVTLKYKEETLDIYQDEILLVSYQEPKEKGHLVQDPRFYEALKADKAQQKKKYYQEFQKGKARVPEMNLDLLFTPVEHRHLEHYQTLVGGQICQN